MAANAATPTPITTARKSRATRGAEGAARTQPAETPKATPAETPKPKPKPVAEVDSWTP